MARKSAYCQSKISAKHRDPKSIERQGFKNGYRERILESVFLILSLLLKKNKNTCLSSSIFYQRSISCKIYYRVDKSITQ